MHQTLRNVYLNEHTLKIEKSCLLMETISLEDYIIEREKVYRLTLNKEDALIDKIHKYFKLQNKITNTRETLLELE